MLDFMKFDIATAFMIYFTYWTTNVIKRWKKLDGDAARGVALLLGVFFHLLRATSDGLFNEMTFPSGFAKIAAVILFGIGIGVAAMLNHLIEQIAARIGVSLYPGEEKTTSVTVSTPGAEIVTQVTQPVSADPPDVTVETETHAVADDDEDETTVVLPPAREPFVPDPAASSTPEFTVNRV